MSFPAMGAPITRKSSHFELFFGFHGRMAGKKKIVGESFPERRQTAWSTRKTPFTKIELTTDKTGVLVAGFEGVFVIDLATGQERERYHPNSGYVSWLARMTADGKRVVSAFGNCTFRVWNAKTRAETFAAPSHDRIITHLSLSQDGTRVMSNSGNNSIALWDIAKGKELGRLEMKKSFAMSCALGGDGRIGAYGGTDGCVRTWDFEAKKDGWVSAGNGWIEAMDASPDGSMFASTGRGKSILLWDAKSGKNLRAIDLGANGTEVSLSPDASKVIAVTKTKSPAIYATATGKPLGTLEHPAKIVSARFSHDGQNVVTCDDEGTFRLFDVA